ncbi:MAG: hypothetical protein Q9M20_01750 [Mariprofundaceae bacterium]|nr:hypothetical protein [Mariprofundaceae bacterium]
MESLSDALHWSLIPIYDQNVPADHICRGRHIRLIMNSRMQYMLLKHFFPDHESSDHYVWLTHEKKNSAAGGALFCRHVGSMIRRRGLLANLSIRENLLLPFLYAEGGKSLEKAEHEVTEVAESLGLSALLYEQAGERSAYTHALVSLGRCILKKSSVIIMQEVHMGMPPERLQIFHHKVKQTIQCLGSGVLYLTSFQDEGSGLEFSQTHEIKCDNVPDMSGIW